MGRRRRAREAALVTLLDEAWENLILTRLPEGVRLGEDGSLLVGDPRSHQGPSVRAIEWAETAAWWRGRCLTAMNR